VMGFGLNYLNVKEVEGRPLPRSEASGRFEDRRSESWSPGSLVSAHFAPRVDETQQFQVKGRMRTKRAARRVLPDRKSH
jgi:hypothetical protein